MRTLSAGIAGHISGKAHKRVAMLRLDLADSSTLALTDHDRDLPFDLGDGAATYLAGTGIMPSDLSLSTGFDADEIEVTGPLVEGGTLDLGEVTKAMMLGGRFDDAEAWFFQVNWDDLAAGSINLLKGRVVLAEVIGGEFKLTIHSEIGKFSQEIGRTITAYCDADFGDARCGTTPVTDAVTVTAVTDARTFTVSNGDGRATNFYTGGTVQFTSGALNGTRKVEVSAYNTSGALVLWADLAEPPEVGDALNIRQGCFDVATGESKTRTACMAFDNIVNFRGFPDVPGTDQVLRYPNPAG